jgi:hypothetical protein
MECKDELKLIDSGGGYLAEFAEVGEVMYIFGLSLLFELESEKKSFGNGGTGGVSRLAGNTKDKRKRLTSAGEALLNDIP